MSGFVYAQSKDTTTAQKIIDKGSKGDVIIGEKSKKNQLNNAPISLYAKDSLCRKDSIQPSKKSRRKQNKKGS